MLQSGSDNQLTFDLELRGTTAPPIVRVVLHTEPALMFYAKPEGNSWAVNMKLPDVEAGSYKIELEALVGNRLYVPLSEQIEVENVKVSAALKGESVQAQIHPKEVVKTSSLRRAGPVPVQETPLPPMEEAPAEPGAPIEELAAVSEPMTPAPIEKPVEKPVEKPIRPPEVQLPVRETPKDLRSLIQQVDERAVPPPAPLVRTVNDMALGRAKRLAGIGTK